MAAILTSTGISADQLAALYREWRDNQWEAWLAWLLNRMEQPGFSR